MLTVFAISFVVILGLGVPISIGLGASAMVYVLMQEDLSLTMLIQTTFGGMSSFPLLAIPLFMLSGNLMNEGGLTKDLVRFAKLVMGHISGGLGLATILASAIFAAISGSAVATAVAIGMVMIPAMKEAGYDEEVGAAVTATASCMGPIIPPSIPFIMYGVIANVSIGALFLGGVIPGLMLGAFLAIYMYLVAKKRNYPREPQASLKEVALGAWQALPALLMPVIIMGGILGGAFTPTEAAGVVAVYALLVGVFFYRKIHWRRLPDILLNSGLESAMVMLLLGLSEPFSWIIASEEIPQLIINAIGTISTSPIIVLFLINILLILVGIPLETAPAITIVTPVIAPIAAQLGIDPIHLGIVVCFNLVLGLITPPVGAVLFSICSIADMRLEKLAKGIWPPFFISLLVLGLITYIPSLTTYLPHLIMK
ncbi:TRAP transporter large permease [uncultured Propionivibrio sp.]|uniref:TRAP transporter large permease n=1 Tax=uncultured Propionivibrio sp. TaxID=426737 RepID=UPI0029C0E169|nr:TRAP transporter large permease [uncultured Propionivibrio sp.]